MFLTCIFFVKFIFVLPYHVHFRAIAVDATAEIFCVAAFATPATAAPPPAPAVPAETLFANVQRKNGDASCKTDIISPVK